MTLPNRPAPEIHKLTTRLCVRRGEQDAIQEYEVEFEEGATVLDGLMWVRAHADASLAIRYSCISANVCKECTMRIDGKVDYACTTRMKPGRMAIEPLTTKPVVRDLVADTVPPKEKLGDG